MEYERKQKHRVESVWCRWRLVALITRAGSESKTLSLPALASVL